MTPSELTRRDFLKVSTASMAMLSTGLDATQAGAEAVSRDGSPLVDVDFSALISRSDLVYLSPVEQKESLTDVVGVSIKAGAGGQPIGNGRMGTMVWTTPSTVEFQINRVDVFSVNGNHRGRLAYKEVPTMNPDYCTACVGITIDVGGQPFAKSAHFRQQLSLYNAESQIQGDGVQARCFVSAESDVLVLEIEDRRPQPQPVRFTLSMWSAPSVQTEEHLARFAFVESGDKHGLTRTFTEKEHYCRSAVAVQAVPGRVRVDHTSEQQQSFQIEPSPTGKTLIFISSAAAMDPAVEVAEQAFTVLDTVTGQSYEQLQKPHRKWWASYWSRTFAHMSSPDQIADFMERLRTMYLYTMASTSRGKYPPKWNGMLFVVNGDYRLYGSQYWGWTMEPLYIALYAAGASDLANPYFNMYVNQLPKAQIAAAQRWNAKGAFIPDTVPFDGPLTLPDDVALEYRNLLTGVSTAPLSERARSFADYDVQFVDLIPGIIVGHSTQLSHILTAGPRIAMHAWWRYRYTGDQAWLRTHAYPLLKNVAEFYRSYAVRRDGRYHIEHTDVHENFVDVNDGILDVATVHGVVPLAIRAAEILGVDADLRTAWREFVGNSAWFAMGNDPDVVAPLAPDVWAIGHGTPGAARSDNYGVEDHWLSPVFPFEVYTLEHPDADMGRIVRKLVELSQTRKQALAGELSIPTVVRVPPAVSRAGLGEELPGFLSGFYVGFNTRLPNGFSTFEAGDQSIEHLGMITMALQEGLLQSISPRPGEPEIIRVFPAWPKTWDGTFSLMARGGFLITSTRKDGIIPFVEIESRIGETCRIRNPWSAPCFLMEVGKKKQRQSGDIIQFDTKAGKRYRLFPGAVPTPIRVAPARTPQASLSYTRANGTVLKERLGLD